MGQAVPNQRGTALCDDSTSVTHWTEALLCCGCSGDPPVGARQLPSSNLSSHLPEVRPSCWSCRCASLFVLILV